MPTPVRLSWELHTRADLRRTWATFSDTDRFNREAGLGFSFTEPPPGSTHIRRIGRMKRLGLELTWDELPFEYEAPHWYRSRREFHGGPARSFTASLRLRSSADGGTDVRYQVEVEPRNLLTVPAVKIDTNGATRKQLDRVLALLIDELDAGARPRDVPAGPLSAAGSERLRTLLPELPEGRLRDALEQLLRLGPLRDQYRLCPPLLADRWDADQTEVTGLLLQATRVGLLSLHWEVLCPSCQAPKAPISLNGVPAHCDSCQITYDGSFPDSVVVFFRPHPSVRRVEEPLDCIGSPALQRHILAQRPLLSGETVTLSAGLIEGPYRLRTWPMRGMASLEVSPGAPPTSLDVTASADRLDPPLLRAEPGQVEIQVHNPTPEPMRLVLESRWRPDGHMTAGRLLQEFPSALTLLPVDSQSPELTVQRASVLAVRRADGQHGDRLASDLRAARARHVVVARDQSVVALFDSADQMVEAWTALEPQQLLEVGVLAGPVQLLSHQGRTLPLGPTVDRALACMYGAPSGQAATPIESGADGELDAALTAQGLARGTALFSPAGLPVHWLR